MKHQATSRQMPSVKIPKQYQSLTDFYLGGFFLAFLGRYARQRHTPITPIAREAWSAGFAHGSTFTEVTQ